MVRCFVVRKSERTSELVWGKDCKSKGEGFQHAYDTNWVSN